MQNTTSLIWTRYTIWDLFSCSLALPAPIYGPGHATPPEFSFLSIYHSIGADFIPDFNMLGTTLNNKEVYRDHF